MKEEIWKAYAHGMAAAMQSRIVALPNILLRSYKQIGISSLEAMLVIHIISFAETEENLFPTPEELADRMGISTQEVLTMLSRLLKEGMLEIVDYTDEVTNLQAECYKWDGIYLKTAVWAAGQKRSQKQVEQRNKPRPKHIETGLFAIFEQEFGRLLSPMECETVNAWLDQDHYTEEVILLALKEAVFAGKLSMRYIDRILMEWSRHRITTAEEAKAHLQRFRAGQV